MSTWKFSVTDKIITGCGCLEESGDALASLGSRALIVCGHSAVRNGVTARIEAMLRDRGKSCAVYDGIGQEPTDTMAWRPLRAIRRTGATF